MGLCIYRQREALCAFEGTWWYVSIYVVCWVIVGIFGACGENMFVEFLCVFKEHSRLDEYFLWYLFAFFIRRLFLYLQIFFALM